MSRLSASTLILTPMKLFLQLANRLQKLSDKLHQHGNHNIARGTNHIRSAWNLNPKPTP
jgi:hypothetical protein